MNNKSINQKAHLFYALLKKIPIAVRITLLLLFVLTFQLQAEHIYSQDTKISLNLKNSTIEKVLQTIEEKSDYYFLYNNRLINVDRKVSVRVRNAAISAVLERLFKSENVDYEVKGTQIILSPKEMHNQITAVAEAVQQQKKTITGTIVDAAGVPIIGANIIEAGTTNGTVTDVDGRFSLSVEDNATIHISYIGYLEQSIATAGKSIFNITLLEDTKALDEVVVIGYGTQSRAMLTTSISKMDSKVLENIPFANVGSALQGTVSGVRVQSTSGQPGAGPRIIIRGGTSINNPDGAAPLYVVDGIMRSDIDDINSADIESIQVLKDAASTAIYGARGSNGIILITTKTGKTGEVRINYKYDLTLSKVGKKYDMASARDFIYHGRIGALVGSRQAPNLLEKLETASAFGTGNDLTQNTGYTTQYLTPENQHKLDEGWESMPDPIDPSKTIIFKETRWQDVLFHTGVSENHNINVSKGTEKANINLSAGYMDNEGIAITTNYKRYTFNINSEINVRDNLKFGGRMMYTNSSNRQVYDVTNLFFRAAGLAPTAKYKFEDGSLAPGDRKSTGNPAYYLTKAKTKNADENITIGINGHWEFLPGLSFDPQFSIWKESADGYNFEPSYLNGVNNWNTTRYASSSYSKWVQTQVDAILSYKKEINNHDFDVTAGFAYFDKYNYSLSASGEGALTDLIPTLNAISIMRGMSGYSSEYIIMGYFGRFNYNYKQKYLVSLSARYDGASQLGKENKWGLFPGVSLGWNLHNEDFWDNINADFFRLKLRGSYGVNGNVGGLGPYQAQGEYSIGGRYLGVRSIENTIIPNPNLRWEESKTFDIGTDISLFENRVELIFDYFNRNTDNLITSLPLPPSTGFSSITTNYGSLNNRGIELEVKLQLLERNSDLHWEIGFNASKVSNKINKLPPNGLEKNRVGGVYTWDPSINDYNWLGGLQEGGTMGDLFAWKQIGIYATDEEAKNAPIDELNLYEDKTKYGGDVIYLDADGNGVINGRDVVYMGNIYPKWTGGISSSFKYKNFDLYLRMDYMTGHTIYNYAKIFMSGQWAGNLNFPKELVDKGWKEQGDIATRFIYIPDANYNTWRGGDYHSLDISNSEYYESGDFLCIRELTLGYSLPTKGVLDKVINNIRFKVSGNNLHYFTKYTGMSPEFGGKDAGRYPLPKNFFFGVDVTF